MQRVLSASVSVDNVVVSKIGRGILIFAAVAPGDTAAEVDRMASKLVKTRFWDDQETGHRWKHSVKDIAGEVLCGMSLCAFVGARALTSIESRNLHSLPRQQMD